MIKQIDRYILRFFFLSLLVVVVSVGITFVVINMVEEMRNFIDKDVPLANIAEYYLYFAGWILKSFFSVFVLLAALFSVSILSRKNEILAMKASGLSLFRIAMPLLLATLMLTAGHFYYNEFIYPPANQRRLEIKEFTIRKKSKKAYTKVSNVFRQIRPGYFYTIALFHSDRREGNGVKILQTSRRRVDRIIVAEKIRYNKNHQWELIDGVLRTFTDSAGESYVTFDTMVVEDIKDKPDDFSRRLGDPADMGLEDLQAYVDLMKRTGGPYQREEIDIQLKYSFPLASFIVVLIAVPFASKSRRGGVAVSVATGALIALVYFVLFRLLQSAGYNEKIPDWLAIWGVDGLFLLVGLAAMIRARRKG
ncbi:MAG: LptF/LptG family permease [Candidatus Zixiibacteriota bacterium]